MDSTKVQIVGQPCSQHGPYTFYKAFRYFKDDRYRILSLGEFFFLKILEQAPVSIGELQLLWEDKNNSQLLTSLRLYFLPEDTPDGKQDYHGEDEILMSEEKIVVRVDDLVPLLLDSAFWSGGFQLPDCRPFQLPEESKLSVSNFSLLSCSLQLEDVEAERKLLNSKFGEDNEELQVVILTYPVYCRLRAMLKRLEAQGSLQYLCSDVVLALVGFRPRSSNCHVLYCRDSYEHPDLEALDIRCDHLAPNLKGRPRKKKSIKRTSSNDSESNDDQSVSSASPSSVKPRTRRDSFRNGRLVERERSEEEQEFLEDLHKFMLDRKTPIERIPSLGFKQIDLYFFYTLAKKLGGYDKITENRQWKVLYDKLGGDPHSTSAATCTRRHYEKLLLAYEEFELNQKKKKTKQKPKARQTANSTNARENGCAENVKPVQSNDSETNAKKEKEDSNSQANSGQARQTVKKILEEKEMSSELLVQPKLELAVSLEPIQLAPNMRTDLNFKHHKPHTQAAVLPHGLSGSLSSKTEVHIDLTGGPSGKGDSPGPGRSGGPELQVPCVRPRPSTSIMSPLIQKKLHHQHHRSSPSPQHSTSGVFQHVHHPISSVSEKKLAHSSHTHSSHHRGSSSSSSHLELHRLQKEQRGHHPLVLLDRRPVAAAAAAAALRSGEDCFPGENSRERPSVIQHTQLRNTPEPMLKNVPPDSADQLVPTPWRPSIPPAHQKQLKRPQPPDLHEKSQGKSKPPPPAHSYNYLSDSGPFFDQTKRPFYLPPRRGQGVVASALFSVDSLPTKPSTQEQFQEVPLDLSNKSQKYPKKSPAPSQQSTSKVVRAWETTSSSSSSSSALLSSSSRGSGEERGKNSAKAPAPQTSLGQFMMAPTFSSELFQIPNPPLLTSDGRLPAHMPEVFPMCPDSRSKSLLSSSSSLPSPLSQTSSPSTSLEHFRSSVKTESPFNHFSSSPLTAQSPQPSLSVLPSTASVANTTTTTTTTASSSQVPATPPPSNPISSLHPAFPMPFMPGVMGGTTGLLFGSAAATAAGMDYSRVPGMPPYYGATYDDLICRQYHHGQSSSPSLLTPGTQVPSHLYSSESKFGMSK